MITPFAYFLRESQKDINTVLYSDVNKYPFEANLDFYGGGNLKYDCKFLNGEKLILARSY